MDLVGETKSSFNVQKQTLYRQTVADAAQVTLDDVIIVSISDIETRRRSALKVTAYTGIRVETSIIAPDSFVADQVVERLAESVDSGRMAQSAQASGIGAVMVGIGSASVGGDSNREVVRKLRTSKLVGTDGIERPRRLISVKIIYSPPPDNSTLTTAPVVTGAEGDGGNTPFTQAFIDLGEDKDALGGVAIGVGCAAAFILALAAYFIRNKRLEAKLKAALVGKATDVDASTAAKEHI